MGFWKEPCWCAQAHRSWPLNAMNGTSGAASPRRVSPLSGGLLLVLKTPEGSQTAPEMWVLTMKKEGEKNENLKRRVGSKTAVVAVTPPFFWSHFFFSHVVEMHFV